MSGATTVGQPEKAVSTLLLEQCLNGVQFALRVPEDTRFSRPDDPRESVRHRLETAAVRPNRGRRKEKGQGHVPATHRARRQHGTSAVRRRATDAGDRTRPHDQSATACIGRGDRGSEAEIRQKILHCLTALEQAGQSILVIDNKIADRNCGPPSRHRARPYHLERTVARACRR
jgi:hypothetical protein